MKTIPKEFGKKSYIKNYFPFPILKAATSFPMALIFSMASRKYLSDIFQLKGRCGKNFTQLHTHSECLAGLLKWPLNTINVLSLCLTHSPFWKATTATSWMTNGSSGAMLSAWLKKRSASLELLVRPYSRPMYSIGKWHLEKEDVV